MTQKYCGLPTYRLVDVLEHVPLPPNCPLEGVSSKWRCVLAPKIPDDLESEEESAFTLPFLDAGIPCRLPRSRSRPAHTACGPDAFDFIYDPRWSHFPKPKIAFKAGWAGPGTAMESEAYHKLITSFQEVLVHTEGYKMPDDVPTTAADIPSPSTAAASAAADEELPEAKPEEILNLQMFHRSDPNVDPLLPILAEKLEWPPVLEEGAVCDNATRVSQRGAVTWWHLDDSGEFVMQTALPLRHRPEKHVNVTRPATEGPSAKLFDQIYCRDETPSSLPTKLFIYGPPNSYDWFMHDDEADTSGKIAALNIFSTKDEDLPDESLLPILTVAVLESSGRPLVSPPNIPHAVFSVNDCVMVEQRRVCNLFLEEVAYFLEKCKYWRGTPIVYQYVSEQLQNEAVLHEDVIPTLFALLERYNAYVPAHQLIRQRIAASLLSLVQYPDHFKLTEDGRASLRKELLTDGGRLYDDCCRTPVWYETVTKMSIQDRLAEHWNTRQYWPKPGCVFAVPRRFGQAAAVAARPLYVPVVYLRGSPVYGKEKATVQETAVEYHHMANLLKKDAQGDALRKYLATTKQQTQDDLLDELF